MRIKPIPPKEFLDELFEYRENGVLLHKGVKQGRKAGRPAGTLRDKEGRVLIRIWYGGVRLYFTRSRIVWKMHYGADPKEQIDHINGIPSDDRIENLREATHNENMWNRKMQKNNSTGFVGVYSIGKKWRSYITLYRKQFYLGMYDTPEEAAAAYERASIIIRGQYHRSHQRAIAQKEQ